MASSQEEEFGRLVDTLAGSDKLRSGRDAVRFDAATGLLPLIEAVPKPVFAKRQQDLEAALLAGLLSSTGTQLQRALVACLIRMYKSGRSYTSHATFGALEDALAKDAKATKDAHRTGVLEAMGALVTALGRMLPCASAAPAIIRQLRSESLMVRCTAIRALAALVHAAGPDIPRSDILKPVGRAVTDASPDVRVACGEAVTALAGLDDMDDGVRNSFGKALAAVLAIAVEQTTQAGVSPVSVLSAGVQVANADKKKQSGSIFSSKKNDPAALTVAQAVAVCSECFVRPAGTRQLRSGLMQAVTALLLQLGQKMELQEVASQAAEQVLMILDDPKAYDSASAYLHARTCACEVISVGLVSQMDEPGQRTIAAAMCCFLATGSHSEMYACAIFGELRKLCNVLGATMTSIQGDVIAQCMASLSSEATAVRLASATCLGALATALPEQRYALLQYCVNVVNTHKETGISARPELFSLHGHVHAASALIASAANSKLGIPFHVTDDILETATALLTQNENKAYEPGQVVAASYWEAGWVLVGSMMQLGATWTSPRLTKLFALWKMALTRKPATKQDGKSITAEFRARMFALSALCTFTKSCQSLLNDQLVKVVLLFLWQTIEPIRNTPEQVKALEPVRIAMSLLKAKVYTALLQLPSSSTGNRLAVLAQMTVSDFCDASNGKLTIDGALSRKDRTLGAPLDGSNGSLASYGRQNVPQWGNVTPLDIWGDISSQVFGECSLVGQRLLESASALFSHLFSAQTAQNQTRVLDHLCPVVKQSHQQLKGVPKPPVVLTVVTALLSLLKVLVKSKQRMQPKVSLNSLLEVSCLLVSDADPVVRRAGSEMLGCLAWLSQGATTNAVLPHALQHLQSSSEHVKAGWALALGCVSAFQLSPGSPRKNDTLSVTVSSIEHLTLDASPEVASWALHALWRTIDSTGVGFAPFTESTLGRLYSVCTGEHTTTNGMLSAISKIIRTLVASMGPELVPGADITSKCQTMARHIHACTVPSQVAALLPQAYGGHHLAELSLEAVRTLRNQLVFCPHLIVARDELPFLLEALGHDSMAVREEATQCIFHIVSRDPEVLHAKFDLKSMDGTEQSLEEILFDMLSFHGNTPISSVIEETIQFVLKETCLLQPSRILYQCRRVITGATDKPNRGSPQREHLENDDNEGDDEGDAGGAVEESSGEPKKAIAVRWQAKKFAAACMLQMIEQIEEQGDEHNFDPLKARAVGEGLVLLLPDIASVAFSCALSEVEELRPAGLLMFTKIVTIFGDTQNPDAEGILLVEDFVAQISAAVREAFSPDALPGLTAAACKLCTAFMQNIVCYSDKNLMKRIKGYMGQPLDSLSTLRYNAYYESESTRVQVAFLEAHARLYLVPDKPQVSEISRQLGDKLLGYWLDFLRDCASLALLSFQDLKQMAAASGCFFCQGSAHQVGPIFGAAEGIVLHAAIACLAEADKSGIDVGDSLHLLLGLCVRNLLAAAAPGMLEDPKSRVRRVSLALALSLPPRLSVTQQLQDALQALSKLFAVKVVPGLLQPESWKEIFNVLEIVASSAFTERSPQIIEALSGFVTDLLRQVAASSGQVAERVVKLAVELVQSNDDFPAHIAIPVFHEAFSAVQPQTSLSFVHAAASRAFAALEDPQGDDTSSRSALSVLKSVASLARHESLSDGQRQRATDVLSAAVTSAIQLLKPSETTAANIPLALMALVSQLDPGQPAFRQLYEAAAAALEAVAICDQASEEVRRKSLVVLRSLAQPAATLQGSQGEDDALRQASAQCMLRCGMTAAVAVVGTASAPEQVRCEGLQLLMFGLEAAGEQNKPAVMAFVAPLAIHMLKDNSAAAAVQQGIQAITTLATQQEFKLQLAAMPASMKAVLQTALQSGTAKQSAAQTKGKVQKAKINFSSFRK